MNNDLIEQLKIEADGLRRSHAEYLHKRDFYAKQADETAKALTNLLGTIKFFAARSSIDTQASSAEMLNSGNNHVASTSTPRDVPPSANVSTSRPIALSLEEQDNQEIKSPDELKNPEFDDMSLIDAAVKVASIIGRPFKIDEAVELIYDYTSEPERVSCRRSLGASLSRAALDGFIQKIDRGVFASNDYKKTEFDSNFEQIVWNGES